MRSPQELADIIAEAIRTSRPSRGTMEQHDEFDDLLDRAYVALGELKARAEAAEGDPGPTLKDIDQILGGPVGKRIFEME